VSPQIEQVLGYTVAEWDTRLWIQRVHPHDRDLVVAASERSAETGEPYDVECRYLHRDGRVVWVWDRATLLTRDPAGRPKLFQGVMLDITARKDAESKAQQAESRFRLLAEEGPAIAYTWDPASNRDAFVFAGSRIEELLGYPRGRWRSFEWFISIVHPDDRDRMVRTSERVATTGEPYSLDYRVVAADGRIVWLHDEGRLLSRDAEGAPRLFQGVLLDVTERLESQRRLEAAEAAHRSLLERMPAVPWTSSLDLETGVERMTYIGPQSAEVLGYTAKELLDEPGHFVRMLHPDDRERVLALTRAADRSGSTWQDEFRVIARDGSVRWLHAVGRAVTPPGVSPQLWHGVTIDVTTIREARDRRPRAIDAGREPAR
jgi:PAS domain S-box-containing protein